MSYLELSDKESPITSLPIYYSYGLSVINSHLLVGAKILLTSFGITNREFWAFADEHKATSISGVPYTYEMLHRINFQSIAPKSLKTLTQAGGRLNLTLAKHFYELSQQKKWKFYIMYGQTEATARISYVPLNKQKDRLDSIGIPIPGGKLDIDPENQELIYYGQNVMLGYAEERLDLMKKDELEGQLRTGDLAKKDDDGFYYIVGRSKRFVKLFGLRMNLDDIEEALKNNFRRAIACVSDDQKLYIFITGSVVKKELNSFLANTFHIHHSAVVVKELQQLPLNYNNKTNYRELIEVIKND